MTETTFQYDTPVFTFADREFRLNVTVSTETIRFLNDNADALNAFELMPAGGSLEEQQRAKGAEWLAIFFPDPARTQLNMRMMLTGDHDGITWAYEQDWLQMVRVSRHWAVWMKHVLNQQAQRIEDILQEEIQVQQG